MSVAAARISMTASETDALTKDFDARQKELQSKRPAEDFVPCLTEVPGKIAANIRLLSRAT